MARSPRPADTLLGAGIGALLASVLPVALVPVAPFGAGASLLLFGAVIGLAGLALLGAAFYIERG